LRIRIIEQAAIDQVVVDRQRRGHERVRVHLRGAAEDDAVLIDDVHLPLRLDRSEDLRWRAGWVGDLVEGDPLARVGAAGALVEVQRRLLADVEFVPAQDRLLRSLLDVDRRLAAHRALGRVLRALPEIRACCPCGIEPVRAKTVRHVRQLHQGIVRVLAEIDRPRDRRRTRGGLHGLHGLNRARGSRHGIERIRARLRRHRAVR
jgi:hypothetical protein